MFGTGARPTTRFDFTPVIDKAPQLRSILIVNNLHVLGTEGTPMAIPHLGRTVTWTPYASDLEYVESYDEPQTESEIIRVKSFTDEKIFDANFAHLMKINT